jgi:hypothetical protein
MILLTDTSPTLQFNLIAEAIAEESSVKISSIIADSKSMSSTMTAMALNSGTEWPFFQDTNFHVIGKNFRDSSDADTVAITPLVDLGNKLLWESFATENQDWIEIGLDWEDVATSAPIGSIPIQIYKRGSDGGEILENVGAGPYAPMWEISQAPTDSYVVNYDTLSHTTYSRVFADVKNSAAPVLSDLVDPVDLFGPNAQSEEPTSLLLYPVSADFESDSEMVATLVGSFRWSSFFSLSLHMEDHSLFLVVDDSCGTDFTLRLEGEETVFLGYGDHHAQGVEDYHQTFDFAPFLETDHSSGSPDCGWKIQIYPGKEFYDEYNDEQPTHMTIVVVFIFFGMSIIFCLYDCAVHSRQRRILKIAAQSERILSILYPKQIRDRLFGHTEEAPTDVEKDTKKASSKKNKQAKNHAEPAKNKLRSFMNEDEEETNTNVTGLKEPFEDKPIADLVSDPFDGPDGLWSDCVLHRLSFDCLFILRSFRYVVVHGRTATYSSA